MTEDTHEARTLDWGTVTRCNFDLAERLFREGLSLVYDDDGDTLIGSLGKGGNEALTEEVLDNIYLRIAPESHLVVGFMVLDFAGDFLANNRLFRDSLGDWFRDFRAGGGEQFLEGHDASRVQPLFAMALSR